MTTITLYDHQVQAQQTMHKMTKNYNGGILAFAPGTGKTMTMCAYLKSQQTETTNVIVCPMSLLTLWKKELITVYTRVEPIQDEPTILIYHGKKRDEQYKSQHWDYIITTYAIMSNNELMRCKINYLVLDEAHAIKNLIGGRKVPKVCTGAMSLRTRANSAWCITATPFNNKTSDLASLAMFIGKHPYNDKNWWKEASMDDINDWQNKYIMKKDKKDMLPPSNEHFIKCSYTDQENKEIQFVRDEMVAQYKKWNASQGTTKAQAQLQILGLITKLRVMSNSIYCEDGYTDVDSTVENNAKTKAILKQLKKSINADSSNSVIIFSNFVRYLNLLEDVIKEKTDYKVLQFTGSTTSANRDKIVNEFCRPEDPEQKRVLLISLTAGGVGLTLLPCSTIFICEPYWNPFSELQAKDRVHRIGQKNTVNIYNFEVESSVEEWISGIKSRKMVEAGNLGLYDNEKIQNLNSSIDFEKDISELFEKYVVKKPEEDTDDDAPKKKTKKKTTDDASEELPKKKTKKKTTEETPKKKTKKTKKKTTDDASEELPKKKTKKTKKKTTDDASEELPKKKTKKTKKKTTDVPKKVC